MNSDGPDSRDRFAIRGAPSEGEGNSLTVQRLGRIRYAEGLRLQAELVKERQAGAIPDTLLLLEHDPVFTLGQNAKRENVLVPSEVLRARGFDVCETGRGGDVTYHGPGQLVAYAIFNLSPHRRDVHLFLRDLEEVMIRTCGDYGLAATRIEKMTGVWVGGRKIGAIGVRIARWVTSHGLALNVTTDLDAFRHIVPCGLTGRDVTSLERELGMPIPLEEVMDHLTLHMKAVFEPPAAVL
jgi:lipoyl(octanoyl) transferase